MGAYIHLMNGLDQLFWVRLLANVFLAGELVIGAAAAVVFYRRRSQPLPARGRISFVVAMIYVLLQVTVRCLGSKQYMEMLLMGAAGTVLLYSIIQRRLADDWR